MGRESFGDREIADILNSNFVSIKVDREEHPDVDELYMHVCQIMTGSGGWPLTIIMTPDKAPVFAGTYLPPRDSYVGPGLKKVLSSLNAMWAQDRGKLISLGSRILSATESNGEGPSAKHDAVVQGAQIGAPDILEVVEKGFQQLKEAYDPEFGGFFGAPKFPMPGYIIFLLGYYCLKKDHSAISMVENTLGNMYRGGIYDHLGFGICRYATDRKWLIPHFEKMLYDNALVSLAALEAYKVTKDKFYLSFGLEIIDYVMRVLKNPAGGFYTAEDADSEGEEGKFYVWTPEELTQVLREDACDVITNYGITEEGNFHGKTVLNLVGKDLSLKMGEATRQALLARRECRAHPMRDEKILIGPNSLMIISLLKAYGITGDTGYLDPAESAMDLIFEKCLVNGRFHIGYRNGALRGLATIDDYSYLLWALIEMYLHTLDPGYLQNARFVAEEAVDLFCDEESRGFYLSGKDVSHLPVRRKSVYDGALPSGNAVMAYNFQRLTRLLRDEDYEKIALEQLNTFSKEISRNPAAFPFWLFALSYAVDGGTDVVVAGPDPEPFHNRLLIEYQPFGTWAYADNLGEMANGFNDYASRDEHTLAYVCKGKSCRPPVSSPGEMALEQ